ncbi:MAG: hypothetical protein DRI65_12030 [Chloroflexota bacterium]|nr:MAG: hypothetical protein DRI65_12030 [Chloroflexota bacterium]
MIDRLLKFLILSYKILYEESWCLMTEEEIFTPKLFTWTGDLPLLFWIRVNTSSQYRWATGNILVRNIKKGCGDDSENRIQSV